MSRTCPAPINAMRIVVTLALILGVATDAYSKDWLRFQESSWDPNAPVMKARTFDSSTGSALEVVCWPIHQSNGLCRFDLVIRDSGLLLGDTDTENVIFSWGDSRSDTASVLRFNKDDIALVSHSLAVSIIRAIRERGGSVTVGHPIYGGHAKHTYSLTGSTSATEPLWNRCLPCIGKQD